MLIDERNVRIAVVMALFINWYPVLQNSFFLPLTKQNDFHDHAHNSSSEFVCWCKETYSALLWS